MISNVDEGRLEINRNTSKIEANINYERLENVIDKQNNIYEKKK